MDYVVIFFSGCIVGFLCSSILCEINHDIPMMSLGIERFQKCEINTTNCHSNWYEIVWKKDNK